MEYKIYGCSCCPLYYSEGEYGTSECRHPKVVAATPEFRTDHELSEEEKSYRENKIETKNFSGRGHFKDDGRFSHGTLNFLPVTPIWCPLKKEKVTFIYNEDKDDSF